MNGAAVSTSWTLAPLGKNIKTPNRLKAKLESVARGYGMLLSLLSTEGSFTLGVPGIGANQGLDIFDVVGTQLPRGGAISCAEPPTHRSNPPSNKVHHTPLAFLARQEQLGDK